MKISLNWIGDYVDLSGVDVNDLIKRLTLSTAEIEGVEHKGSEINGVIVAKIIEVNDHPKSNHLHLLKIDTGAEILNCVCGAKNVSVGTKVAFAQVGANVVGMKIELANIAGYESRGMCCAKDELGLEEKSDGIWEITDDIPLGTDIKEVYDIEDTVIEIDNKSLTNRPDLWGHYGIAREVSAILHRPLKTLVVENCAYYSQLPNVNISISSENCLRYCAVKVNNVTKKSSPENMQIRLFYCGMRSLNLLTDLTNYVMLELGQPMHAFDGGLIKNIDVKEFNNSVKFTTLDKQEREVPAGNLFICNDGNPVAIAGVMGGLDSEIQPSSTSVVFESACFDATSIRKTSNKLGLRTEASNRYEKSLDPELSLLALKRILHCLRIIDKEVRVLSNVSDVYNRHYNNIQISTTREFICNYIGVNLSNKDIENILTSLGFKVGFNGINILVDVPSFRATKDISIPVDIVEEIARIYGYDKITPSSVVGDLMPVEQNKEHLLEYDVKQMLAEKFGLNEVHTYIWNDVKANENFGYKTNGFVKVLNSTVKDNNEIRSELVPTLLKIVLENKNTEKDVQIFEIARVVTGLDNKNLVIEEKHLGAVLYSSEGNEKEIYFKLKNIITTILEAFFNVKAKFSCKTVNNINVHSVNNAEIIVNSTKLGYLAVVHPKIKNAINKKGAVVVLEIDFAKLAEINTEVVSAKKVSKYQKVNLDFNFVMEKNVLFETAVNNLKKIQTDLDYEIGLKDIYIDEEKMPNQKSVTFSVLLSSKTHTLLGEEIDNFSSNFILNAGLFGYLIRQ